MSILNSLLIVSLECIPLQIDPINLNYMTNELLNDVSVINLVV